MLFPRRESLILDFFQEITLCSLHAVLSIVYRYRNRNGFNNIMVSLEIKRSAAESLVLTSSRIIKHRRIKGGAHPLRLHLRTDCRRGMISGVMIRHDFFKARVHIYISRDPGPAVSEGSEN